MKLYLNRALSLLATSAGIIIAASAMIGPIYALLVEQIGGDLLDASLTFFIYSIVTSITLFISGKLFDHKRQGKNILVLGFLLIASGTLHIYSLIRFKSSILFKFSLEWVPQSIHLHGTVCTQPISLKTMKALSGLLGKLRISLVPPSALSLEE